MPETYDRCLGGAVFAPYAADIALRAAALRPQRVLELAAGTGVATAELVAALPGAHIMATDLNPPMVAHARTRVPRAAWEVADASDLAYADDSFDVVVCQFGVMFLPDRVAAYRGVRRVLAPGGSFLFNAWDSLETHEVEAAVIEILAELFPADPPQFLRRTPHGYADPDRIRADVEAAGYEQVEVERVALRGRSPSAATLAEGYCLGTPLRFELAERGAPADLVAPLTEGLSRRFGDGPVEFGMSAHVARGRRPIHEA
ncbi:class I SAM-dependent methyltransferase [Nocardioides albidus]|uniref:Class I SAM-dependent methyltransferase n=2 Tax=Nocardioides albidus TaxID=1517589 RepID=A0A5C4WRE1_9ACTN|nr:class I SAM-dependent methyltransferase [Nocardioides albidus]